MAINATVHAPTPPDLNEPNEAIAKDDAAWILGNAFLILTMQTGFGFLECGSVSPKNTANIMVKNVVDVSIGGFAYWLFGYALSFGKPANAFIGYGSFMLRTDDVSAMGSIYTHYVFEFSFASTATTIVSGAVAERMKLSAYIVFSFLNTIIYCVPASWAWNQGVGFLNVRGFFDFAGSCAVHLNGGISALVSCIMIGARHGRYDEPELFQMNSPTTAMAGMFMLCWAWLAFNCGSTYGINGKLWKIAAKVAVTTLNGGIGGGLMGLLLSGTIKKGKYDICWIINAVLGGLVGVTASCSVIDPLFSLLLGMFCGTCAVLLTPLLEKVRIDDPVGAIPVHCLCGFIATVAVGVIGKNDDTDQLKGMTGLIWGGGFQLLGVQLLGIVCIGGWAAVTTFCTLFLIDKTIGLRVSLEHEILGADLVEHSFKSENLTHRIDMAWSSKVSRPELEAILLKIYADMAHQFLQDQSKKQHNALMRADCLVPTEAEHHIVDEQAVEHVPSVEVEHVPSANVLHSETVQNEVPTADDIVVAHEVPTASSYSATLDRGLTPVALGELLSFSFRRFYQRLKTAKVAPQLAPPPNIETAHQQESRAASSSVVPVEHQQHGNVAAVFVVPAEEAHSNEQQAVIMPDASLRRRPVTVGNAMEHSPIDGGLRRPATAGARHVDSFQPARNRDVADIIHEELFDGEIHAAPVPLQDVTGDHGH